MDKQQHVTFPHQVARFVYRIGKPVYKFLRLNRISLLSRTAFAIIHYAIATQKKLELSLQEFAEETYDGPRAGWSMLRNADVTGGSRLITKNNKGYISCLQDADLWKELKRYKLQEEAQALFHIYHEKKLVNYWPLTESKKIEGVCFSALSPFSGSWVHWLFEIVPQLLALSALPDKDSIKILIEPNAPAQILETITLFFPAKNIVVINNREQAQCSELLLFNNAHASWSVLWTRNVKDKSNEHYRHNFAALKDIQKTVYARFGIADAPPEKYLFIRRKAVFRFIHNEAELADLLTEQHFEVIEPSAMSFREQVEIFSNTKMIVAQAGAALANIIFMKPGSSIVCLAADSPFLNYSYFQSIADAFGVTLHYVLGAVDDVNKYCYKRHLSIVHPLNASFTINKADLQAVLAEKAV